MATTITIKIVLHLFWLIDWWLTCWLTYWLLRLLTYWPIDCLTDWLSVADRLLDFLASSLTNWLDWPADILRFMLRKGIKILLPSWCESRLLQLLIKMTDFSFQICPADVSRHQQPGFWAYLQYCKCCIDCFVTQLLSEPDELCSLFKERQTYSFISF